MSENEFDGLNDMSLWDAEMSYDPTAELNQQNLVPDDVRPVIVWKLGQRGVSAPRKAQNGQAFFMVSLQGNVVAPGAYYDNLAIFDDPTSIVFEGGSGKLQAWLKAVGRAAPSRCSLGELKKRVEEALAGGPQCKVRGQWQGSVPDGVNEKTGKTKYKVVVKGMKKFPQRPDKTHEPIIVIDGVEVKAQYKVMDYQPLGGV